MGKKYENISPAIFALPCLLIMEAIHAAHIIPQDHIKDFQLISNTLLLIIGVYSLFSARVQTNHFKSNTLVYFLSNSLVVLCGYILNIDVFENKIHQISDLWTKWHILWLIGSLVLILLFSDIGKNSYKSIVSIFRYLTNRTKIIIGWGENTIKNNHKGVIFYVVGRIVAQAYAEADFYDLSESLHDRWKGYHRGPCYHRFYIAKYFRKGSKKLGND